MSFSIRAVHAGFASPGSAPVTVLLVDVDPVLVVSVVGWVPVSPVPEPAPCVEESVTIFVVDPPHAVRHPAHSSATAQARTCVQAPIWTCFALGTPISFWRLQIAGRRCGQPVR